MLAAAQRVAPESVAIDLYRGLGRLPLFNADLESQPSAAVDELSALVAGADALLIAGPEYAHGVSGALKNALDWLVGGEAFVNKPVALWNASPRATHAQAALAETITTMSGRLSSEAALSLPLLGTSLSAAQIAADADMSAAMRAALERYAALLRLWL